MDAFRLAKCGRINVREDYRLFSSLSNRYLKHTFPQGAGVEVFELPDLTPGLQGTCSVCKRKGKADRHNSK